MAPAIPHTTLCTNPAEVLPPNTLAKKASSVPETATFPSPLFQKLPLSLSPNRAPHLPPPAVVVVPLSTLVILTTASMEIASVLDSEDPPSTIATRTWVTT